MQQMISLLQMLLLAQHVSGTNMSIIRSSRVLYSGCCLWYLVFWFSSCRSCVKLWVVCPVYGIHPAKRTHKYKSNSITCNGEGINKCTNLYLAVRKEKLLNL